MRRVVLILLLSTLFTGVFSSCKGLNFTSIPEHKQENEQIALPSGDLTGGQPIVLRAMVMRYDSQPDYASIEVWKEYEKMTGVKVEWIQIPSAEVDEKRNQALASGNLPDMFMRCKIPDKDLLSYGEKGVFVRMNELIEEHGPNVSHIFNIYPDVKRGMTMYNGSIYSLPSITEQLSNSIDKKLFINRVWLDKLKMEMPRTIDEFYQVLKAFRENDPNENGKADEIPLSAIDIWSIIDGVKGAWGLGNRGRTIRNFDLDESTGKVRFISSTERFREVLAFLNKLYAEGLLDNEIFATNSAQLTAKGNMNILGSFLHVSSACTGKYENDFSGIPEALIGPYGDQLWSPQKARLMSKGQFAMTSANPYPEITMKWMDYWFSDDGIRMFYMGLEGVTYIKTSEGTYEWTDRIKKGLDTKDNSFFNQIIPYPGGNNPVPVRDPYFRGATSSPVPTAASEQLKPFLPNELWSTFNFTTQENERIILLERNILGYVEQMVQWFIAGKEPLSNWDQYLSALNEMGLDEYIRIYQAAYERYMMN